MSITNSAIHEALGETGVLDLGMVERAVAEGVRETENLDWKGSDPYVPKPRSTDEQGLTGRGR